MCQLGEDQEKEISKGFNQEYTKPTSLMEAKLQNSFLKWKSEVLHVLWRLLPTVPSGLCDGAHTFTGPLIPFS